MRKIIRFLLILICCVCVGVGIYLIVNPEPEGESRQSTEEQLAEAYLSDLIKEENTESAEKESTPTDQSNLSETEQSSTTEDWSDDNWYSKDGTTYTPDYAKGTIDCVLEVPSARIRRGVYTGSWSDIQFDLDIWMVTAARPDMILGETHYVIYGHNHTVQNLSFNNLINVQIGEYFTLTNEDGVYFYRVTNFFADWRENVQNNLVNNFSLGADKCYLLTCGRNEYRYKDIVFEGTLEKIYSLEEWNASKETVETVVNHETEETTASIEVEDTPKLVWKINTENPADIEVMLTTPADQPAKGVGIGLFDSDGLLIQQIGASGDNRPVSWMQTDSVHHLTNLPAGEYVIGVIPAEVTVDGEKYEIPYNQVLTITKTIISTEEVGQENPLVFVNPLYIAFGILGLFGIIILILLFSSKKKK